ncbi:MAG: AraC family transcriptional regulator N-terminal domain-containing protein [Roseovarius sp.]
MSLHHLQRLAEHYIQNDKDVAANYLPSLHILRKDTVTAFEASVYNPVICLILQGRKETHIGQHSVSLGQGDALLVSHDLPVVAKITEASPTAPYLALILALDIGMVRSLYEQVGEAVSQASDAKSLAVCTADATLLDPLARYLRLIDRPLDAEVLGPLILKEIHFQLLMSPIGGMLRNLQSLDSHASRIAKAITRIRAGFREPLIVADLADMAGMSQSSFHEHFKSITGTTPLQYQKDLRMIEAQRLLAGGMHSVSNAGFDVGYESPTHFSRDYSRKFGCSPKHHLAQTR